ncbi:MAG: hypothetical protein R3357_09325 [Burkholderiales bacterium]|nr:hypothetical protein [Burkholderiales bacterium]
MIARRRWIARTGAALLAARLGVLREALAAGRLEKGVYRVRGEARVNGVPAREGMDVKAGDVITTGADGELVFVIGKDAMLVRRNARVEVAGRLGALVADGLRIVTGAVLSVYSPGARREITVRTATIGIRGTAVYVEDMDDRAYVCTCYGVAEIAATDDAAVRETVATEYHDQPRYLYPAGAAERIVKAPVINHSDAELILLESLVGREPPFLARDDWRPGRY